MAFADVVEPYRGCGELGPRRLILIWGVTGIREFDVAGVFSTGRRAGRALDVVAGARFTGLFDPPVSLPLSSTYLPPPPGPPGTYRSFLRGGSEFAVSAIERTRGRPALRVLLRLGEGVIGAIYHMREDVEGGRYRIPRNRKGRVSPAWML